MFLYFQTARSLHSFPIYIKEFQFLNMVKIYVEHIENHNENWTREEKTVFDETYLRFIKIFRINIESNGSHPKCTSSKSDNENNVNGIGADEQKALQQQYGLNEKPGSWRKRDGSPKRPAATPNGDLRGWRRSRNELDNFSGRQNAREIVNSSWRSQRDKVAKDKP